MKVTVAPLLFSSMFGCFNGERINNYGEFVEAFGMYQIACINGLNYHKRYNSKAIVYHAVSQVSRFYTIETGKDLIARLEEEYMKIFIELVENKMNFVEFTLLRKNPFRGDLSQMCASWYAEEHTCQMQLQNLLKLLDKNKIPYPKGKLVPTKKAKDVVYHLKKQNYTVKSAIYYEEDQWLMPDGERVGAYGLFRRDAEFRHNLINYYKKKWRWRI